MESMKEHIISDYILHKVNFKKDWSLKQIKEDLKKMLGEEPALKINYEKDAILNEVSGESKEIKKIKSVDVIFTDEYEKIKTIGFIV